MDLNLSRINLNIGILLSSKQVFCMCFQWKITGFPNNLLICSHCIYLTIKFSVKMHALINMWLIKDFVCVIMQRFSNDVFNDCLITSVFVINGMGMLQQCMIWYIVTEWSAVSSTIPCHVVAEFCLQLGLRFTEHKEDTFNYYFQKNLQ